MDEEIHKELTAELDRISRKIDSIVEKINSVRPSESNATMEDGNRADPGIEQ